MTKQFLKLTNAKLPSAESRAEKRTVILKKKDRAFQSVNRFVKQKKTCIKKIVRKKYLIRKKYLSRKNI